MRPLASAFAGSVSLLLSLWALRAGASEAEPLPSGDLMPRLVPRLIVDGYYSRAQPGIAGQVGNQITPALDNTFALNLAVVGVQLEHANLQGELMLQYGSSVDALYSTVGASLRILQTAWVGWRTGDFTLKAGVLPAHLGHESFFTTENWCYSRTVFADATPYFFAGVQVDWRVDPSLLLSGRVFNGWQTFTNDTSAPSGALVATWHPNDDLELRDLRVLDDFVATWAATSRFSFALEAFAGADLRSGTNAATGQSQSSSTYYGGALWARVGLIEKTYVAARGEILRDDDEVLIGALSAAPTKPTDGEWLASGTLTFGYRPHPALLLRVEGVYRTAKNAFYAGSDSNGQALAQTSSWNGVASAALSL
jgi:hypothetical protein